MMANSWIRDKRDIVLLSQRGTGGDNHFLCPQAASDDNLQGYLDPFFSVASLKACRDALAKKYDLSQYSTFHAAEDMNELRLALGYDTINLMGGSYGTRMALIYMRQYPGSVRSAMLNGVAPVAAINPLYHALSAQSALEKLLNACAENPRCAETYPNAKEEFWAVIDRLDNNPVEVMVTHPVTVKKVPVWMTRDVFAESIRFQMYSERGAAVVPAKIHEAFLGNYVPFLEDSINYNRTIVNMLSLGLLMCVTCNEDVSRIETDMISSLHDGTYLGEVRVRDQMAACAVWPETELPDDFGDPVKVNVPVLLLSGILDPVTPPRWGEEAHHNLPNSLHVAVPGSHGVRGTCIDSIMKQFLERGKPDGVDISCTEKINNIVFRIPQN